MPHHSPNSSDTRRARLAHGAGDDRPVPDTFRFADDGRIPNSRLPVLIYRAVEPADGDLAPVFEALFDGNDWPPQWRGGVFDFHHYHSVSHETLGVVSGRARLMLGGEAGRQVDIRRGDVVVLPAGTGHCRLQASADFELVAAYPPDQQDWDLCRADADTHDAALARIAHVAVPRCDPVTGRHDGLCDLWRL